MNPQQKGYRSRDGRVASEPGLAARGHLRCQACDRRTMAQKERRRRPVHRRHRPLTCLHLRAGRGGLAQHASESVVVLDRYVGRAIVCPHRLVCVGRLLKRT